MNPNTALTGTMDDYWGRHIAIHQDHDSIRIDVAGIEIMLTQGDAERLRSLLFSAGIDAANWEMEQAEADA